MFIMYTKHFNMMLYQAAPENICCFFRSKKNHGGGERKLIMHFMS